MAVATAVLAIVAINVTLIGAVVVAHELWPSFFEDEESVYVCKSLDNGLDAPYTPVKVCISRTDIRDGRFEACTRPAGFGGIAGPILIVYDGENDTYCAVELPEESE